jgi:hypothetical protein
MTNGDGGGGELVGKGLEEKKGMTGNRNMMGEGVKRAQ